MIKRKGYPSVASARFAVIAAAGLVMISVSPAAVAEEPSRRPPAAPEACPNAPGTNVPSRDRATTPSTEENADTSASGKQSEPGKADADPTTRALGGQIPLTASARNKLLNDLYALLATAEDEPGAKKVQEAIEKVWRRAGSDTVSVILQRATKATSDKRIDLAGQLFDAAVDLAPDYAEAWNRRAFFHYKQNDFTRALGDLRRTLALEPNHFRALEGVATILRETGDERGAFKAFERLMELNPMGEGVQKGYDELKLKVQGRGI